MELVDDNVRVTVVEPGAVETELADHITNEEAREGIGGVLSGEILQPEHIADAIAYCVTQPERVSVNEILIRPTQQADKHFDRSARQAVGGGEGTFERTVVRESTGDSPKSEG